jgi:hypothetical protein
MNSHRTAAEMPSSLLIYSTSCVVAWMRCQNNDASRRFASREGLCPELGEVEKCHDGIFQRTTRPRPTAQALSVCQLFALVVACCATCGCTTYEQRLMAVRDQFYSGNLEVARQTIDKERKRYKKEADVLLLEKSIIELADGHPKQAEQLLRQTRDSFDHLEQFSAAEVATSMLSDDNAKSYAGEDYEKVLIRAMLALSNLMGDGGDAGAYALQVTDKQQQIIDAGADKKGDNPKLAYQHVAVGAYVQGMLREATHSNYDDAARASAMVCSWQPDFPFAQQDLERANHGRHSAPGNGVLYVFTLVGHGPYKAEKVEMPSTAALAIAGAVLSATSKYGLPPNIAPVKVPIVVVPASQVDEVRVAVDQKEAGATATITDVGQMAVQQYEAIYPRVLARAVVRRVVKNGLIYGAEEVAGQERGSPLNLGLEVLGLVWMVSEAADTRCWGLLPGRIQVLRIELPAGDHQVTLQPASHGGPAGAQEHQLVSIANGRNTYLLANFPDSRLVGKILTSQP